MSNGTPGNHNLETATQPKTASLDLNVLQNAGWDNYTEGGLNPQLVRTLSNVLEHIAVNPGGVVYSASPTDHSLNMFASYQLEGADLRRGDVTVTGRDIRVRAKGGTVQARHYSGAIGRWPTFAYPATISIADLQARMTNNPGADSVEMTTFEIPVKEWPHHSDKEHEIRSSDGFESVDVQTALGLNLINSTWVVGEGTLAIENKSTRASISYQAGKEGGRLTIARQGHKSTESELNYSVRYYLDNTSQAYVREIRGVNCNATKVLIWPDGDGNDLGMRTSDGQSYLFPEKLTVADIQKMVDSELEPFRVEA